LQIRTIGATEPVLLAALGVLNLGAAFYVRKSAAQRVALWRGVKNAVG
jgi:hypothetical protein